VQSLSTTYITADNNVDTEIEKRESYNPSSSFLYPSTSSRYSTEKPKLKHITTYHIQPPQPLGHTPTSSNSFLPWSDRPLRSLASTSLPWQPSRSSSDPPSPSCQEPPLEPLTSAEAVTANTLPNATLTSFPKSHRLRTLSFLNVKTLRVTRRTT
jgi:hypothetical protein